MIHLAFIYSNNQFIINTVTIDKKTAETDSQIHDSVKFSLKRINSYCIRLYIHSPKMSLSKGLVNKYRGVGEMKTQFLKKT